MNMKSLFLPILIVTFYSCSSKANVEKGREEKIFTFSKMTLKDVDSTYVLDSVRIIKYDTVTDHDLEFMRFNKISAKLQENQEAIKQVQSKTISALQIARLSRGLNDVLFDTYKSDADKYIKEAKEMMSNDSIYRKEMDLISVRMEKSDTSNLKFLQVRSLMQYHRKDLSVSRDTIFTFFDPMGNIIRQEDIK